MKKLLIVLMVLSMASMANAALVISVGSDLTAPTAVTVAPSGTLSLGVWTNTAIALEDETAAYYALVCDTTKGTIDWTTGTDKANDPAVFLLSPPAQWDGPVSEFWTPGLLPANFDGTDGGATPLTNVLAANSQISDGIIFHCNGPGTCLIQLWISTDGSTNATLVDTVTVTQTPEPMTIGLLGLGGLFLRRRK